MNYDLDRIYELPQIVRLTRQIAILAHGEQLYGTEPYVVHLDAVVGILWDAGERDDHVLMTAYMHDVLEDTSFSWQNVVLHFPPQVGVALRLLTDETGPNRKIRKAKTYAKIHSMRESFGSAMTHGVKIGLLVKLADRIANVRAARVSNPDLFKMYRKEATAFREVYEVIGDHRALWSLLEGELS